MDQGTQHKTQYTASGGVQGNVSAFTHRKGLSKPVQMESQSSFNMHFPDVWDVEHEKKMSFHFH